MTASEDREGCEEEEEEEGIHLEEVEREGREDWGWWWEGLMGMEWRRTSGRTSAIWASDAWDFVGIEGEDEEEEGYFWERRSTACFDSCRKYAPSAAADLPARKLMSSLSTNL